MCGIAGYVAYDPRRPVETAAVGPMLSCIRHRGPDDEGVHAGDGVVLGHTRLSIIDPAGGHQPLRGRSPETFVVCNGEIYNYRELKRELEARGHAFRTGSDTEVAAHAYDAWGLDFLERLDGMFALALWDGARRRLVLARDGMGEKPLYHASFDGLLLFASELRSLLAHPAVPRRLDRVSLTQYLALEYVPAPRSLVEGVGKLEPGHALVLENGSARVHEFWRVPVAPEAGRATPSYADAVAETRRLLDEAVRSRLVSDVPLGVFLSGGIDSSTVAALAARHGATETFSIGFDEPSFDESRWARLVADHAGTRHHERVVRAAEMPELVPSLGRLLDEPIGDASVVPTTLLSRFAREHVKVALGGDGGDELFAGYPMHRAHRVAPIARLVPRMAQRALAAGAARLPVSHANFSAGFKALSFLRGAAEPAPVNHALWMSSFSPAEQRRLLSDDTLAAADPARHALQPVHAAWARSAGRDTIVRAMHLDATTYLPGDILAKVDRASMSTGLEVRAPMLARDVVRHAFAMPGEYHMRGLTGKRLLRDATRGLVPDAVLDRPKKGFGMPVAAWLQTSLRPLLEDALSEDALRDTGLFRPDAVRRLIHEHQAGRADRRKPLWTLLVLELWRRETLP